MRYKIGLSPKITNIFAVLILMQTFSLYAFGDNSEIPNDLDLEDEILQLLGGGIRNDYFIDIYHIGFYSDAKKIEEIQKTEISHHIAVRIEVLTDILPDTPPPYWMNLFNEVLNQEQFELFTKNYAKLSNGDVLAINFIPGKGTYIYMKKKRLLVIKSNELITAVIKGFIGPNPVSDDLKDSILEY
ncbi:MAG: hypothetical protein ACI85N_002309 [Gammaproteobacteria bacterium]|jgi:hypothetical protein